ncbi:MAG: hypothetical protein R3F41_15465 [Gammaproteobacteria bacterium]|nr:hypothetical protein [Pseudomonadales bacterium]
MPVINNIKKIARKIVPATRQRMEWLILTVLKRDIEVMQNSSAVSKTNQLVLRQLWLTDFRNNGAILPLGDVEFRAFSQNGEDGILLYIFSIIGTTNKKCVEICAGNGIECNSANLILNHGWQGLLIDGKAANVQKGKAFYSSHQDSFSFPPKFIEAWVERENVNQLISDNDFSGDVDLLSIDMDGVDYWIWDAIDVIKPRVVVVETQCIWGADTSVTVPYRRDFSSPLIDGFGLYSGASLLAFNKLAKSKGYRLIGTQALGFNAFFVREDVEPEVFPEVTVESCLDKPFVEWAANKYLKLVKDKDWETV